MPEFDFDRGFERLGAAMASGAAEVPFIAQMHEFAMNTMGKPAHLMTFENLIVQIKKNPAFVHKVMDFIVDDVLIPYCRYMHKQFPDLPFFDGSDATASLPFITQDMQEEFSEGPILRLQEQLELPCYVDNWWGDSYTDVKARFWASKLKVTPGYFKIQDPDLWKVGLAEPMAYAKRMDKPVVLGIDNNLFQSGPETAIRQRVHEYMEAIEDHEGRGCVYFCSLSAVTPAEHVKIAIDAVQQFRRRDRPWAGDRVAGTAQARGEAGQDETKVDDAAPITSAALESEEVSAEEQAVDEIFEAVLDHEDGLTVELVNNALGRGVSVHKILDDALIAAMDEVGEDFSKGVIFVPEMLMAARAMKAGLEVLRPILTATGKPPKGKVMLATVQGDMQKTLKLFRDKGALYPVIIGGAPVTEDFADHIGADGYGENAPMAVATVHRLVAQSLEARTPPEFGQRS